MRICPQCGTRFEQALQFCPHDGAPTYEAQVPREDRVDPLLGLVVDGRYRIEKQIGEGGMGVVYMATHTVLQKKLALKVLRGDGSKDAETVQRFMQEAQAATSIGHQNIIDISDFGRLPDGCVYFVMEYLDGVSLSDMIKDGGSVPMSQAVHILRQIASALEAAHARGIVHRDLKPDNIIVIRRGADPHFVKVLDFGVAKVGGAASKLTKTGMVFGTPHYMSPEQAAGHSVDQRTDIYALGVIMYEMFSGKVPFDADTFMGILSKHMFEPPPRPTDVKGASLGTLEAVILRSMEKNPDQRYLSMSELIEDLDTVAAGGTVELGGRAGVAPPGNLADALEPATVAEMSPAKRPSGILLIVAAAIALLVAGTVVGGAVFFLTDEEGGQALAQDETPTVSAEPATQQEPTPAEAEQGSGGQGSGGQGSGGQGSGGQGSGGQAATAQVPSENPSAPPVPAPVAMVRLSTDPEGAEVLLDDVMVGNTPVDVPRPTSGTQSITLRMRGYRPANVQLSPQSSDALNLTLERERRVSGGRRRREPVVHTGEPPVFTAPPERPPTSTRRRTSEVVDPWAM